MLPFIAVLFTLSVVLVIWLIIRNKTLMQNSAVVEREMEQLREFESQLKTVFDRSELIFLKMDISGEIIYVNRAFAEMIEQPKKDILHRNIERYISKKEIYHWDSFRKSVIERKNPEGKITFISSNGKEYRVKYTTSIENKDGIPMFIYFLASICREEEWERDNLDMIKNLSDRLPLKMALVQSSGEIIYFNAGFDRLFSAQIAPGDSFQIQTLFSPSVRPQVTEFLSSPASSGVERLRIPARPLKKGDKQRFFSFYRILPNARKGKEIFLVFEEVAPTDTLTTKKEAGLSYEQIHNLHNVFSAIRGFTELIAEGDISDQDLADTLNEIIVATNNGRRILNGKEPLYPGREKQTAVTKPDGAVEGESANMILLIDDDRSLLRMNTIFIERLGYRVQSIDNGAQALQFVKQYKNDICLVISDFLMPDISGVELADEIYRIAKHIPVILLSGKVEGDEKRYKRKNIKSVMIKPVNPEKLKREISSLVTRKQND